MFMSLRTQNQKSIYRKFCKRIIQSLGAQYESGPDVFQLILPFLFVDFHSFIQLQKNKFTMELQWFFSSQILVYQHCKIKFYGVTQEGIIQKLIPRYTFYDYCKLRKYVDQYVQSMNYLNLYPEIGISYNAIYRICDRLRVLGPDLIIMIGFNLEAYYTNFETKERECEFFNIVHQDF